MAEKPDVELNWEGPATLREMRELVRERVNFELQLPADYHFALFQHLFPNAPSDVPEQIDISGTAELIDKVAQIQGLQELAELAAAVAAAEARIRIRSPGPGILVCFPAASSATV